MLTYLEWAALILWACVGAYSVPAVYKSVIGHDRREGDPARLLTLSFAVMICGFTGRRLWFPHSQEGMLALFAISIGVAIFTLVLMWSYGRGRRV